MKTNVVCPLFTSGYCEKCAEVHRLEAGNSPRSCRKLMESFVNTPTINLTSPLGTDKPFAMADLFGPARGKMFGIMECLRSDDSTVSIKAFSGQLNGMWQVEGWAPPLFDVTQFEEVSHNTEKKIKELGQKITQAIPHSENWLRLKKQRRNLSQQLMHAIHDLYRLTNFSGETATLREAFIGTGGIPTGTGDCCAPKLLNFAARNNLRPTGIAEFYWGKENKSGSRQHGSFYSSCIKKCQPILGFMLCGLNG